MGKTIKTAKLLDAVSIGAAGVQLTVPVDLQHLVEVGKYSLSYTITGAGTIKLEYLVCQTKTGTYIAPAGVSPIGETLAVGSGSIAFTPVLSPFIKIRATEDGGAAAAVLSLWLNVQ